MSLESGKMERRTLERSSDVVEVLAPAAWPNAQVEAWLDWAGGDVDLPAAIFRFAETTDKKYMKTISGRVAVHAPWLGVIEVGLSGEYGGQDEREPDRTGPHALPPWLSTQASAHILQRSRMRPM